MAETVQTASAWPEHAGARFRRRRRTAGALGLLALALGAVLVQREVATSAVQARLLAWLAQGASFQVEPGAGPALPVPSTGPYDARHGYDRLPELVGRLRAHGFRVESQARWSPGLRAAAALGLPAAVREPAAPGLVVTGDRGRLLFAGGATAHQFADLSEVPPVVVEALLFIENRELLDPDAPRRNPAVEWDRLAGAGLQYLRSLFGGGGTRAGGSTLATQIEKFRHSPGGVTHSPREKLRQLGAASLRAYRDGEDTRAARREIVVDYLNSVPLAAVPGHGEVIGLLDAIEAFTGEEPRALLARLADEPSPDVTLEDRGRALVQVVALLAAVQRPSAYLRGNRDALRTRTDAYLRLLAAEGRIDAALTRAALEAPLAFRARWPAPSGEAAIERKPAGPVRVPLVAWLGTGGFHDLDRLDLHVESTLDVAAQRRATEILRGLRDPAMAAAAGLVGHHLLSGGDPADVVYGFALYERGDDGFNRVRVQTDSSDGALDVVDMAKLDLGSTAKLRTLVTYLEAVAALHDELGGRSPAELRRLEVPARDRLTRFVADELAARPGLGLDELLEAALERRYSASPFEAFFTGGGIHRFRNFDRDDDGRVMSVRRAFRQSVNLPFIRLMRDLVDHEIARAPDGTGRLLDPGFDARRNWYLVRSADAEGRLWLARYERRLRGLEAEAMLDVLVPESKRTPRRLAVALRSVAPEIGSERFAAALRERLPGALLDDETALDLYEAYAPERFSLSDRGYLARVHPLALWVGAWLHRHPEASRAEIERASARERLRVARWLFQPRQRRAQDRRIRTLLEMEAFERLHAQWQRTGYPFASLVPSYATAIGSSADRPSALAELSGILLADGVRRPTLRLERLRLAEGTSYETVLVPETAPGERVIRPEVAAAVRGVMGETVENGTARRAFGALEVDGEPVHVAGKTGTGDERYKVFGRGGRLLESRVVGRTATFVFQADERFYGVVTAYVRGEAAARHGFTSSLPAQVFRVLAPEVIAPRVAAARRAAEEAAGTTLAASAVARGAHAVGGVTLAR